MTPTAQVMRQLSTLMTMVTLQSVTCSLETDRPAVGFVVLPVFARDGQPEYQIEIHLGPARAVRAGTKRDYPRQRSADHVPGHRYPRRSQCGDRNLSCLGAALEGAGSPTPGRLWGRNTRSGRSVRPIETAPRTCHVPASGGRIAQIRDRRDLRPTRPWHVGRRD